MKDYDGSKESPYRKCLDVSNLYDWVISLKFPLDDFKWVENKCQFNEDFIENYNEDSDEGFFLEVDVQYPKILHELHYDLQFLPERMKIENIEKVVVNLHDKEECAIHIRNLMQALRHWSVLKNVHRFTKFNLKAWPKPYIGINTKFKKQKKIILKKIFSRWSIIQFSEKLWGMYKIIEMLSF